MKTFKNRNYIHGISFHHRSSQRRIKTRSSISEYFNISELRLAINKGLPQNLAAESIFYLLCDQGRNEINSLVSICTENITKWDGIVKTLDRCFSFSNLERKDYFLGEQEDIFIIAREEIDVYLEAKKLLSLWKHKLKILEMIVEAQGSYRFLNKDFF
ncbi:hypothetical protein QEJ31_13730 [Pigmentibacter sp. JX0631]|uniref:hypothetical protein n=1 Tax=Pigmentibacter sp. JX0631 TaxID=2976982 RepID=UPI0024682989|nr:hypothetical protein [Pigmentibacter sp. JX0631]WGL59586.1 hypothetical protein QEJ31_13730 [Pigmentibacter sp. JX0631]